MRRGKRIRSFSDSESVEPLDLSDTEDASVSEASNKSFLLVYFFYLIVGVCTNLIGKQLLTFFPYTKTVTMAQLSCTFFFSIPACYILRVPSLNVRGLCNLKAFGAIILLTIGKFTFQFATQQSMRANAVSFTHTVKSTMPIFTVFFERIISRHHSYPVYISLIPIVLGVTIASYTESQFTSLGLVWALIATGVFSMQNIGSKVFMEKTRIHTLRLLSILAGLSSFFFFSIWVYSDWVYFQTTKDKVSGRSLSVTLIFLFADGFFNFLQNFLAFTMIGMVTPLTYSVFNVLKRLIVILTSIAFFHNPVTGANAVGMIMAITGVWFYNKAKIRERRLKKKMPVLPLVRGDKSQIVGNGHLPCDKSLDNGSKTKDLMGGGMNNRSLLVPSSGGPPAYFELVLQR